MEWRTYSWRTCPRFGGSSTRLRVTEGCGTSLSSKLSITRCMTDGSEGGAASLRADPFSPFHLESERAAGDHPASRRERNPDPEYPTPTQRGDHRGEEGRSPVRPQVIIAPTN